MKSKGAGTVLHFPADFVPCKVCGTATCRRSVRLDFHNDVEVIIVAPLCPGCHADLPGKVKAMLSNPMVGAVLRTLGVKMGARLDAVLDRPGR
jgi:hypothetical protein